MTEMAGTNMNNKATILVVDDEHGVRQSFNIVLRLKRLIFLQKTILI